MATKNNPGKFDCYANAHPDEPMFVLLGRDKQAPKAIREWIRLRKESGEKDPEKFAEAEATAEVMEKWAHERKLDMWERHDALRLDRWD